MGKREKGNKRGGEKEKERKGKKGKREKEKKGKREKEKKGKREKGKKGKKGKKGRCSHWVPTLGVNTYQYIQCECKVVICGQMDENQYSST